MDRHGADKATDCFQRCRADFGVPKRFGKALNLAAVDIAQVRVQAHRRGRQCSQCSQCSIKFGTTIFKRSELFL